METILNVKHISKRFGQQLALDDVNLTVKQKNTASFDWKETVFFINLIQFQISWIYWKCWIIGIVTKFEMFNFFNRLCTRQLHDGSQ